eukprot:TRINITY_DN1124_c0_g1_i1.p1 TRINITY_DN1124_c0_g1~~TRINITY_DN1124_c0_g1_i1.p1  ORF type:complete len:432 (-),score=92.61 TRINITY_DN1124_c0_g1_i1:902-2197(-)
MEIEGVEEVDDECATVIVEVALKDTCTASADVEQAVRVWIEQNAVSESAFGRRITPHFFSSADFARRSEVLTSGVDHIRICDIGSPECMKIIPFHLCCDEPSEEVAGDEADEVVMCTQWELPAQSFEGVWESLYFEPGVKEQLLDYVSTSLLFSDLGVDQNIIACNRVVLLHGPPGTGKTSLCHAVSQKLAIRFADRYPHVELVEVNAHSLFSKWFSESGKLVMRLFETIREQVEEPGKFVCVLIDEVESLTAARKSAMSGSEPSDAIRVVNALLTQLDQLRRFKNVLVLTTSNITGAIDVAFVDRADIKQYIGPPNLQGRYEILCSCCNELVKLGIIRPSVQFLEYSSINLYSESTSSPDRSEMSDCALQSLRLLEVAKIAEGKSGRALRKYPFIAHAKHIRASTCTPKAYLAALKKVARDDQKQQLDAQ